MGTDIHFDLWPQWVLEEDTMETDKKVYKQNCIYLMYGNW
jgi:hypothetical protein